MQELIKIEKRNGIETVNARDLWEFIESKQDFSTWIKNRIEKYLFVENEDFTLHKFVVGKATQIDYYISIDMAKELAMVENNLKGKEARQYFIECERKLIASKPKLSEMQESDIITMGYELVLKQNRELKENLLRLIHSTKLYAATEIAKELRLKSAIELNKLLEENKIQYKINGTWVLCAQYSELDYTSIKQQENEHGVIIYDRKWTGKGRDFILNLFKNINNKEVL
jgi:phage anti-repressor protein